MQPADEWSDTCPAGIAFSPKLGAWVVTDFALAHEVLAQSAQFSPDLYGATAAEFIGNDLFFLSGTETHRRLRRIYGGAFSADRVRAIRDQILKPAAERSASHLGPNEIVDICPAYVRPYCTAAIFELVGVDKREGETIVAALRVAHDGFRSEGRRSLRGRAAIQVLTEMGDRILRRTDRNPISLIHYLQAQSQEALAAREAVGLLIPWFDILANKLHRDLPVTLLERVATLSKPDQTRLLNDERASAAAAEEAVRLQETAFLSRRATENRNLGSYLIKKGDVVLILLGETSKDPSVFADPSEFNPWRLYPERQLGFGVGAHSCVGRLIAKTMAVEATQALLAHFFLSVPTKRPARNILALAPRAIGALTGL